jgi:1,4-dihydroxy-2-naphthoate octaprenyltransferase
MSTKGKPNPFAYLGGRRGRRYFSFLGAVSYVSHLGMGLVSSLTLIGLSILFFLVVK